MRPRPLRRPVPRRWGEGAGHLHRRRTIKAISPVKHNSMAEGSGTLANALKLVPLLTINPLPEISKTCPGRTPVPIGP
jgi:hypothetical protein